MKAEKVAVEDAEKVNNAQHVKSKEVMDTIINAVRNESCARRAQPCTN